MTNIVATDSDTTLWTPNGTISPNKAGEVVSSFLDVATTSFGRATAYNTRDEQQKAELKAHSEMLALERDLYVAFLTLPGILNRAQQLGLKNLLGTSRNGQDAFLTPGMEREVLYHLIRDLPTPAMLRLMVALQAGDAELGIQKANNARTRKLILRTLLGAKQLQLWSVKYRRKMRSALTHAWGRKLSSVIRSILSKDGRTWTKKERGILRRNVDRFAAHNQVSYVRECVGFIFGLREKVSLPMFKAFLAARTDLSAGAKARLPLEVLEGIRSVFHKDTKAAEVLKQTAEKGGLTTHQKMTVQKRAQEAGVEVKMDPTKYDAVRLYLYAFEMGATEEILEALDRKAEQSAFSFPARYDRIGVIVDGSQSMYGDDTAKMRPLAAVLSIRDMLLKTAKDSKVAYCGGSFEEGLLRPQGHTALADGLLELLKRHEMPDVIFALSDGYENAPAGRFAEVVGLLREVGIDIPIYHLNPTFAAETGSVRSLCGEAEGVSTLPAKDPNSLGLTFLRGLIEAEPVRGINTLLQVALEKGQVKGLLAASSDA